MSLSNSELIKLKAKELGFDFVGISKARRLNEDADRLEAWLKNSNNANMGYMENHFEKRVDPRKLVEGAKSVVSLLYNYHTKDRQLDPEAPKIAKYAFGEDYHFVIREKLNQLLDYIQTVIGEVDGRGFVDSAPILDRAWARESGMGWIGKNSMLINKQQGSDFFIAELILDLELEYDHPIKDYCGTCTKCIDSCPTDAILPNRQIDSKKCISYLTIELKEEIIPKEFEGKMEGWAFGCDICQDVCPWNKFGIQNNESRFQASPDLLKMTKDEWEELREDTFKNIFKNSPIKRAKFSGLKRNIEFLKKH